MADSCTRNRFLRGAPTGSSVRPRAQATRLAPKNWSWTAEPHKRDRHQITYPLSSRESGNLSYLAQADRPIATSRERAIRQDTGDRPIRRASESAGKPSSAPEHPFGNALAPITTVVPSAVTGPGALRITGERESIHNPMSRTCDDAL